jgi:hypothetical protein
VSLEAMVQLHYEGVIENGTDLLFVLNDVFFLVLADEPF